MSPWKLEKSRLPSVCLTQSNVQLPPLTIVANTATFDGTCTVDGTPLIPAAPRDPPPHQRIPVSHLTFGEPIRLLEVGCYIN